MSIAPIALTCGEPAGVGLELAEKAWSALKEELSFVWIGDPRHLPKNVPHQTVENVAQARDVMQHALPVFPVEFEGNAQAGQPDPRNAAGVVKAISRAVDLATEGKASAVCTAPINKKALKDGTEFPWPGHTEFLADYSGAKRSVMMLASDQLRVVPTTIHIALDDVRKQLTADLLRETILITHNDLRSKFGILNPRIAIAGLNPHAGEGGTMGTEEIEMIIPVVQELIKDGLDLTGPMSADTMFHAKARARYDAAICMYHDQALIPIKTLDFDNGVNVTLGLPFIRTSPDHGTAFDIAGKNIANPQSTIQALRLAAQMAQAVQPKT